MVHSKLGYQALLAILLGVLTGFFFGPLCHVLKPIGDLFVFSLQIMVIPYIPSLLMHGLGSLSPDLAKKLFKRGWLILVMLWIVVLAICYIVKNLIPVPLPSPATDFSLEATANVPGTVSLIVPGNKIYDVFNNIVPVIVIFSVVFGMAIMHLKEKDPLLSLLERVNNSLDRIIKWISIISPIGIFAHVAYVMGTVDFHDLAKLQLYIGIIIGLTLFLSVWVLPTFVSCLTSIPYKDLLREYRTVGFLPFATAIPTIALPYINNAMRRLAERKNLELGTFKGTSQTIVPIGFGFAQLGNLLPILFLLFMSFYYRHPLTASESILLPILVTMFSIGTPQFTFVALPFLLKTLTLPAEGFNLYAEISAITLNFQVLLSMVSMLSFIYLVTLHYYGLLEIQWKRLAFHSVSIILLLLAVVFLGKQFIHTTDNFKDLYYSLKISEVIENPPQVTLYSERVPPPPSNIPSTLAKILERKVIRVGYDPRNIPFCYYNQWNELVGYDIAYAYQLAKDLDVSLELVPIQYDTLVSDVNAGYCDTVMSAIVMDEDRIIGMEFSNSYIEQANVLVVPVSRVSEFSRLSDLQQNSQIKIGAQGAYREVVRQHFSAENLVVGTTEDLLEGKFDVFLWAELEAYIWCLSNPSYTTLSYNNQLGKKYYAYPMRQTSEQMVHFINEWLTLKQEQGFEQEQRQYWFLGKSPVSQNRRWSILRNVLHWDE